MGFAVAVAIVAQISVFAPPRNHQWMTQVSHGAVTGSVAGACALTLGDNWLRICGAGALASYVVREIKAHVDYRDMYERGELTRSEFRCARWDSKMDVVWPAFVAGVLWDERLRKDWRAWAYGVAGIAYLTVRTTPGEMYSGMYC